MADWFAENAPKTAPPPPAQGDWFAQNAPAPPKPPEPSPIAKAGHAFAEGLGLPALLDILRASNRYGTPQEVAARGERGMAAAQGIVQGIAGEPGRVWGELSRTGESMLKGDVSGTAYHLAGAVPILGAQAQQVAQDVQRGDPAAAVGHTAAMVLPFAQEPIKAGLARTAEASGALAEGAAKTAKSATGAAVDIVGGLDPAVREAVGVISPRAKHVLDVAARVKKARDAFTAASAEKPRTPQAAPAAAHAGPLTLDDVLILRHLGETDPLAATAETVGVARDLAAQHPELLDRLRPGATESFVQPPTAAEAAAPTTQSVGTLEYNAPAAAPPPATTPGPGEEGAAPAPVPPAEPPPPPGGGATPVPPKGAEIAAQLEESMRAETLTDYLVRNKIPGEMVAEFGPKEWEMVSQQAGVQPPTPEHIDAIRRNLAEYEGAATITAKTPAEAAAEFEVKKKVRAKRKPKEAAAEPPAAPEVTLPPGQSPAQALADLMGPQPQPPGEGTPAPTASEIRVEGIAKHLAEDKGINVDDLATVAEKPAALEQLDKLREALGIDGAVIGYELPQIIDRVRQLRGEGAPAGVAVLKK